MNLRAETHQRMVGAALGMALLAILAAALVWAQGSPGSLDRTPGIFPNPLPGGERMSLEAAIDAAELPVYRPQEVEASDESISEVWVRNADSPETYITYSSGIVVTIRPNERPMGTTEYYRLQIADGIPGSIGEVAGLEAFIVPQDGMGNSGSVQFVLNRSIVTVIGVGDFSTDQLTALASSIISAAASAESEANSS